MKIEGVAKLNQQLRERAKKWLGDSQEQAKSGGKSVIVGFTAAYALYVHENMEMRLKGQPRPNNRGFYWDPQGTAGPKFLEGPARELNNSGELSHILNAALQMGKTLMQGLLLCGLRVQREAMQRVPVDTGNLKASAFTRLEE